MTDDSRWRWLTSFADNKQLATGNKQLAISNNTQQWLKPKWPKAILCALF
jgi:hypothetical protein